MSHSKRFWFCSSSLFAWILLAVSASQSPGQETWGEAGSAPQKIVELLHTNHRASPTSIAALGDLISSVEGKKVRARLSVMEVTEREVFLLPDVTYGFPTVHLEKLPKDLAPGIPLHSAVMLQEAGIATPTQRLVLKVGRDIDAVIAKDLRWNDKVLVDFVVDLVEPHRRRGMSDDERIRAMAEGRPVSEGTESKAYATIKISGLRFLKPDVNEFVNSHRTWLWPGPGTLPYYLSAYQGGDGFGLIEKRTALSDFASLTKFPGAALLELVRSEETALSFKGQLLRSLGKDSLRIPKSVFSDEQLKRLTKLGDKVLLYFDANVIEGVGPVSNPHWNKEVIKLSNFQVGTDKELALAEAANATMEQAAKQYELAIESDNDRKEVEQQLAETRTELSKRSDGILAKIAAPAPEKNEQDHRKKDPPQPGCFVRMIMFIQANATMIQKIGVLSSGGITCLGAFFVLGSFTSGHHWQWFWDILSHFRPN